MNKQIKYEYNKSSKELLAKIGLEEKDESKGS